MIHLVNLSSCCYIHKYVHMYIYFSISSALNQQSLSPIIVIALDSIISKPYRSSSACNKAERSSKKACQEFGTLMMNKLKLEYILNWVSIWSWPGHNPISGLVLLTMLGILLLATIIILLLYGCALESEIKSRQAKVSLLGVDSLWGDCTFIPADWGS